MFKFSFYKEEILNNKMNYLFMQEIEVLMNDIFAGILSLETTFTFVLLLLNYLLMGKIKHIHPSSPRTECKPSTLKNIISA